MEHICGVPFPVDDSGDPAFAGDYGGQAEIGERLGCRHNAHYFSDGTTIPRIIIF